jgi:geranylgeranyl diphosphate synthase type II
MKHLSSFQNQFEEALAEYRASLPDSPLFNPISYILSLGGKRIRPTLVLLAGKAFGAKEENSIPAAIAVEVFHNFSLVHDDIMDEAPLRRGVDTVHSKWNQNTAILSGDAMLIEAYCLLAKSDRTHLGALIDLFNTTSMEVCEGQQLDMDFERKESVTAEEYIEMIRLKTAVLLGCSMKMGAILGDAPKEDADHLYKMGIKAGIGFQIQDDYLDAFGDPSKFGKQVGGDIMANKKTFLTINAFERAEGALHEELTDIVINNAISDSSAKVKRVLEIYRELGVDKITKAEISRYFMEAQEELEQTSMPNDFKEGFIEFLEALQIRKN